VREPGQVRRDVGDGSGPDVSKPAINHRPHRKFLWPEPRKRSRWDKTDNREEAPIAGNRQSSDSPLLKQEQRISAPFSSILLETFHTVSLELPEAGFHSLLKLWKRSLYTMTPSHKNQAAIFDELFPGLTQQRNPHQFSHPSFNQVPAVGPFMHFLADHKTDARLAPARQRGGTSSRISQSQVSRNRFHRVRSKEEAVQHKTIITAQPFAGQCPLKVSLGFETVGFFQHANIESRTRSLMIRYRAIL
jgi:hypothetical protein